MTVRCRNASGVRCGFSLIEIMVATTILIVIVLIMNAVFHQCSLAWDSGVRKSEGNTMARAALGFMARELSGAIQDDKILSGGIRHGDEQITFHTLAGQHNYNYRMAKRITYDLSAFNTITRTVATNATDSYQGGDWESASAVEIAENVSELTFLTSDAIDHIYDLPRWIRIRMRLKRSDDVSGIRARSAGPNGIPNDDDDIASW